MRNSEVSFHTFREILLLKENTQLLMLNLTLYGASFAEWLMTWASFFAPCIPVLLTLHYITFRKRDLCRTLIVWVFSKLMFWYFNDDSLILYKVQKNEPHYIC